MMAPECLNHQLEAGDYLLNINGKTALDEMQIELRESCELHILVRRHESTIVSPDSETPTVAELPEVVQAETSKE